MSLLTIFFTFVFPVLLIAVGVAYQFGALDPLIQQIATLFFKAKAEAEVKKLQAQGLKEGEDFVKGDLAGSKQAAGVQEKFGDVGDVGDSIGDLKKGF